MNSYIKNKRRIEKKTSILNICFWIINLMFVEMSVNMFLKIISAGTSTWFDAAAKEQVSDDPFFIMRTELIMTSMIVLLVVIIMFSSVMVVLIRNIQLKNMYTQVGVYTVVGYDKCKIFEICMMEPLADIAIAFPISIGVSIVSWKLMSEIDTIRSLLLLLDSSICWDILAYVMAALLVILVVVVYTRIFIQRCIKKGISYMLGKGVL